MKVLILGCSFSTGSHAIITDPDNYFLKQNKWAEVGKSEQIDQSSRLNFWYGYLPENWKIDCYSHSGGGYMNYAHTLAELVKINKLCEYDLCIIQETFEYRFTIYNPHCIDLKENFVKIDENTNLQEINSRTNFILSADYRYSSQQENDSIVGGKLERMAKKYQFNYDKNMRRYLTDIVYSSTSNLCVMSSVLMCNRLLEEHNVPTYAFRFSQIDFSDLHTHVDYLPIPPIKLIMWRKPEYHNFAGLWDGHFTKAGQHRLGKMVTGEITSTIKNDQK